MDFSDIAQPNFNKHFTLTKCSFAYFTLNAAVVMFSSMRSSKLPC